MVNKKILFIGIGVIILVALIGIFTANKEEIQEYTSPSPEEVVKQYFVAWNDKRYQDMYATISDGFKRIDLNAKDLATFRNFASSHGIEGVNIISIELESMTMDGMEVEKNMPGMPGMQAVVAYNVEFILVNGNKQPFSGTFTLKYRQGDVILGWKLIHPYGENVDTS